MEQPKRVGECVCGFDHGIFDHGFPSAAEPQPDESRNLDHGSRIKPDEPAGVFATKRHKNYAVVATRICLAPMGATYTFAVALHSLRVFVANRFAGFRSVKSVVKKSCWFSCGFAAPGPSVIRG